jgi:ketosteroid isomerase-like protein
VTDHVDRYRVASEASDIDAMMATVTDDIELVSRSRAGCPKVARRPGSIRRALRA